MKRFRLHLSQGAEWICAVVGVFLLASCANPSTPAARVPYVFPPGPTAREFLLNDRFTELDQRFTAAQKAYASGLATDTELRVAIHEFYDPDPSLAPKYDEWVVRFPKSYVAHLGRGIYYSYVGYQRRGVLAVTDTTASDLTAADAAFGEAMRELTTSMGLDPRPLFSYAIAIFVAQEHAASSESRHWLDQADTIDPTNYVARARYMASIETRWGGSQQIMQAFLEECRTAKLSEEHMRMLESVVVEDQGWVHQFVDHDYAAAESAYRKSRELGGDPQWSNLAIVLWDQGKRQEVIETLTEGLKDHPGDANLLTHRGAAYMKSGMPREGIADLRAAAEAGSSNAQNDLGVYYMIGIPDVLPADPNLGYQWLTKSAAQANQEGQQNLDAARQPVSSESKSLVLSE